MTVNEVVDLMTINVGTSQHAIVRMNGEEGKREEEKKMTTPIILSPFLVENTL
jgi:hypothetical protein